MINSEVLKIIKKAISDKKGTDIVVFDVKKRTPFANYYILATANNVRQIDAIKENVVNELEKHKINIHHVEGKASASWVLIDAHQYIINIFSPSERARINLDQLLSDNH